MRTNGEITFGKILRGKRTARGFTQRELAGRAGVDASYISQLERDHKSPSSKTLLSLAEAAKAYAFLAGRDYVIPEDVQAVAGPVVAHRLILRAEQETLDKKEVLQSVLESIAVPLA